MPPLFRCVAFISPALPVAVVEFMPASHIRGWFRMLQEKKIVDDAGTVVDVSALEQLDFIDVVTCQPPSAILRRLGITHLNVWVLDVEGGELEVVRAFNFDPAAGGVSVDVILLEVNDDRSPRFTEIVARLAEAGMHQHKHSLASNRYFVHEGFVPISGI